MSHELRTPLNSILILAQVLADNVEKNLLDSQIEASQTIYASGRDLLNLINDILDLSKVEAGKLEIKFAEVEVEDLASALGSQFRAQIRAKSLSFEIKVLPSCPTALVTDRFRLEQFFNAIKFTEKGQVTVTFASPTESLPDIYLRSFHCDFGPRYRHRHPRQEESANL